MNIDNIKNLMIGILTVLLLLSICMTVDYADETITSEDMTAEQTCQKLNQTDIIILNGTTYGLDKDAGVAKVQKVVTEKPKVPLITIVSKPSCGCRNKYVWHKRTFVNYCPYCGKYGVLTNLHKYPSRFEQEISCGRCRSDWCGVCGKEKYSWSKRYLRRA